MYLYCPRWYCKATHLNMPTIVIDKLGPAKTHILRGTPQTHAIKTRTVTDD